MTHVERAIEAYFEGRLSDETDRDALFGHLDRCTECREHFNEIARGFRMLSQDQAGPGAVELSMIGASLLKPEKKRRAPAWWAGLLGLASLAAVLFVVRPVDDGFGAKGGASGTVATLEVLCFNEKAEMSSHLNTHLHEATACKAPGYLKIIYASPRSVKRLTVAAVVGKEVRFITEVANPRPRSVLPNHARLVAGETIKIIAVEGEKPPLKELLLRAPVMQVQAVEVAP